MIIIMTWQDGHSDRARCGTIEADNITAVARLLVAAGVEDQPWRTITRTGTPSLSGKSVHRLARIIAVETDKGLRWARYRQFSFRPNPQVRGSAASGPNDLPRTLPPIPPPAAAQGSTVPLERAY